MLREAELVRTLVELADALVDDFDVVELLTVVADRCVEVLDVDAAGIMIASPEGQLQVVASSSEEMRLLELFELQVADGPCPECFRTGRSVIEQPLLADSARWPYFGPRALAAGFQSVYALPMRHRDLTIGAVNLFCAEPAGVITADLAAAQAFADIATIAILQHRSVVKAKAVNAQLTSALNSRVIIEQAKGMVAERAALDMNLSFERLRTYARNNNLRLAEVARLVVEEALDVSRADPAPPTRPR